MKSKIFYILVFTLFTAFTSVYPQQKMTVKPENFKAGFTNEIINSAFSRGYFIYPDKDFVTTSFNNIRVFPSSGNQSEPSAAILNSSPVRIFIGANTDNGVGYYYSLNAGSSWAGGDVIPGSSFFSSTPSCIYGSSNRVHYNYTDDFIVSDRSNNYGGSWLGRVIVPSTALYDMNNNTADISVTSPYNGRVYSAWSDFTLSQPAIFFSYSNDGGATYTNGIQIGSPAANHYEQGCNLQTATNGDLYCFWATPNLNTNIEDHIAFSKSVNGGGAWSAPVNAITINGIRGTLPPFYIRTHSFPSAAIDRTGGSRDGYIYLCWAQKNLLPAGSDADICFCYSANGGSSWSTPIRVNDDVINNGKNQFLPRMTVDQTTGKIGIVFYDTRDFINNDSCFTYLAVSYDGGTSFVNIRVSTIAQRPNPLTGYSDGYFSDYNGIVGLNDSFYAVWTDNRNGPAQIFSSEVFLKPYISFTQIKDSENLNGPYSLQASISTFGTNLASGETKVLWGRGAISDSIVMTNSSGNNWTASIPGNGTAAQYYYYIKTKDASGKVSTLPDNAPASNFIFKTGADIEKPIFYFAPFLSVPKHRWPDTTLVRVVDNTGVDSVWIVWYKNNPSAGTYRFNLNPIGNDYYKGIFNSSPSQVESMDSIYYRIFARDISSNHNVDSSALYQLYIARFYNVKIGNGTSVTSYPFKTFNTDSRTDILIPASELITNGGTIARIMAVGFNVAYASPQVMTNFNLKIKNTTLTSLTGFTSSGWTNVYPMNYTVPGSGMQYIIFQTSFIWDGISNLLFEICYDNTTFNSNSSVLASPVNNMVWHQSQDLPTGNGCNDLIGGTVQPLRPNLTFVFNAILSEKENTVLIPKDFSLSQNYPNPFNPSTNIKYQIPKNSFVTLKIYDILGREIITLINEKQNAGTYITQFSGELLPSGVYFYKLVADDFSDVKKMILIK